MKMKKVILMFAVGLLFTGCKSLYKEYEPTVQAPENIFGDDITRRNAGDTVTIAQLSWREFFTDPHLQQLIELALANNTDVNSARISVEKSALALKTAKLAYLPSVSLGPQGSLSKYGKNSWVKTYDLGLNALWDIDVFGSITNKKRAAKAAYLQSQLYEEAVRSNLISTVAQYYFKLLLLDREMEILIQTDSLWAASLETEKALWQNGLEEYSTAINQLESSWLTVKTEIVDTRNGIRTLENELCKLLCITPQPIARSRWNTSEDYHTSAEGLRMFESQYLKVGIPAQLLEYRPDIRMANYAMEEAFYNTQTARAAFYPSISLSGSLGWTNSAGGVISNPGSILLSLVGSLTQPIFARGQLKANLKANQLTEEDQQKKYVQTVIEAGNDVNQALTDCQAAIEKHNYFRRQVQVLHSAFIDTHYLMDNGQTSYLEVLTAQESFLSAQLNEAENLYNGAQAVIALYIALGGGSK